MHVFSVVVVVGTLLISLASSDFADYLNKVRYSATVDAPTLADAGVLTHTFDGQENGGHKPWTVNNRSNDHISCALCNRHNIPFGGGSAGFILNVKNNHFFCYYADDGGTGSDNWCHPPGPSPTCIPGCSTMIGNNVWHPKWCTGSCQSRGPYKTEDLRRFLEVNFRSINSELLMDPTVYMDNLYKPARESSLLALSNCRHDLWERAEADLGRKIPLVKYDREKGDKPYSCIECPEEFDNFGEEEEEEEEDGETVPTFLGPLAFGECNFSGSVVVDEEEVALFYTSTSCSCSLFLSRVEMKEHIEVREPSSQIENCLVSFQGEKVETTSVVFPIDEPLIQSTCLGLLQENGVVTGFWYYETASKWDILIQTYENNEFSKQLEFRSLFDNFLSLDFYSLAENTDGKKSALVFGNITHFKVCLSLEVNEMFTLAAFQENDGVQSFQMRSYGNPVILGDSSPQQIVGFSVPKGELHALSWKLDPLQSFSFPTKSGFKMQSMVFGIENQKKYFCLESTVQKKGEVQLSWPGTSVVDEVFDFSGRMLSLTAMSEGVRLIYQRGSSIWCADLSLAFFEKTKNPVPVRLIANVKRSLNVVTTPIIQNKEGFIVVQYNEKEYGAKVTSFQSLPLQPGKNPPSPSPPPPPSPSSG